MMQAPNIPLLKVTSTSGTYDEYPLSFGVNLIGRISQDSNLDTNYTFVGIKSQDNKMSRKHFYIEWGLNAKGENFLILYDDISANGTILKGYSIKNLDKADKIYLVHNDEIIIGDTSIFIHLPLTIPMMKALIVERAEEDVKTMTWGVKR